MGNATFISSNIKKSSNFSVVFAVSICLGLFLVGCSGGGANDEEMGGTIQNNQLSSFTLDSLVPSLGDSGSQATIFGTNLFADNILSIKFGSVDAFVEAFDSEGAFVKVRVPAQPIGFSNPAPVTVELNDGSRDSLFPGYFYQNNANCADAEEFPDIISVDPINLVTDTQFTVHGFNFDIGALTSIAGVTATVAEVSDTVIVADLPEGLSQQCDGLSCTFEVQVNNENGCSDHNDALAVLEGFAIEYAFPNYGNNMMGIGLAAAFQSIDNLTDSIPDFANLTAENLMMHSGDALIASPIWSRSLTDPGGSPGDLPCYQPKSAVDSRLKNVGDMNQDGFNDFAVSQSIFTSMFPDPFLAENRVCFISGKGVPFDDIFVSESPNWGYNVEGAGDHILIARNFWFDLNISTADRIDICTASELADGNASNNCTAPYASIDAATVGESVNGFGRAMLSLGDIDDDGSIEFLVGAPSATVTGGTMGKIFLYSVEDVQTGGSYRNRIVATFEYNGLGSALARAGDLDDDGVDDFVVTANGRLLAFSAKEFNESSTSPAPLFILDGYITSSGGINPFMSSVLAINSAGDVNGDGKKRFYRWRP